LPGILSLAVVMVFVQFDIWFNELRGNGNSEDALSNSQAVAKTVKDGETDIEDTELLVNTQRCT
jgi:hypothetical protein